MRFALSSVTPYITGTNEETVEKHRAITRQQANELLDQLNIKR